MQVIINFVRTLIFAASLVCLTLDSLILAEVDAYYDVSYLEKFEDNYFYYIFKDIITFIINGIYIINVERRWNRIPMKSDYVICFLEVILWTVYVIKEINKFGPRHVVGIIIIFLYLVCVILLYQLSQKLLRSSGVPNNGILNSRMINYRMDNPVVGNVRAEMNRIVMNNAGTEMNNARAETNDVRIETDNDGVGVNNASVEVNNAGAEYV